MDNNTNQASAQVGQDVISSVVTAVENMAHDVTNSIITNGTKYGPEVLSTAEYYIRSIAVINTLQDLILIIAALICLYIAKKCYKICENDNFETPLIIVVILFCVAGIIMICCSVADIFSTDNVLSLFSPKLELINMAKNAIVKH